MIIIIYLLFTYLTATELSLGGSVLTLVQAKEIRINIYERNGTRTKKKQNHSKYNYTYYQNTPTHYKTLLLLLLLYTTTYYFYYYYYYCCYYYIYHYVQLNTTTTTTTTAATTIYTTTYN